MPVEQVQVLEECAVLRNLNAGDILPPLIAIVPIDFGILQHLIDLHQAVAVVEIIVEVDQHLAARDLRPVLQLNCYEYGTDQRRRQRENPYGRLLARAERVHDQQAQQHQQNAREYYQKGNACLVLYLLHDL